MKSFRGLEACHLVRLTVANLTNLIRRLSFHAIQGSANFSLPGSALAVRNFVEESKKKKTNKQTKTVVGNKRDCILHLLRNFFLSQ